MVDRNSRLRVSRWKRFMQSRQIISPSNSRPNIGNIFSSVFKSNNRLQQTKSSTDVISKYFEFWNQRKMSDAASLFSEDCEYEDTLYPGAFTGKVALKNHLFKVADAVPPSFRFIVDDIAVGNNGKIGVQWHVESDGQPLPFTRGCSMYTVNKQGLICKGFDVPEPVVKSGSISLAILKGASSIIKDPSKAFIWLAWTFYCWLLFISDLPPGPPAFPLDPNTVQDVINLSYNFWFILPIIDPNASPVMHPGYEAIFNFNLVYAALFSGFLTDGRKGRSTPMLPVIIGMQFLTNAVYLPYLAMRETDTETVTYSELTNVEKFGESRTVPLLFGSIGVLSIVWGCWGRPEFGDLEVRTQSLLDVLNHSLVGSSFVIDILYFALFQGYLIDDDLKRRGVSTDTSYDGSKVLIAKYLPFFGLVYYFLTRPQLKQN
eukprot:gene7423-15166_t